MKFIFVFMLFILSLNGDMSFENDKKLHFVASVPFGMAGEAIVHPLEISGVEKVLYGTLIGLLPGVAKEFYDEHNDGVFDEYDLAYDALGSLSGALSAYYFTNWVLQPEKKQMKITYRLDF